jgi:predicted CoA-binding protein
MTVMERIQDFLGQKRFAIAGVSREPRDFSRALFRELCRRGYEVVPVNPQAREIDGRPCFSRLQEVQPPVETVLLMTPAALTETVVRDCKEAGVKRVWMYRAGGRGAVNPDAVRFCESNGMTVIPGECPLMFLPGSAWFHRFHGLVKKITRTYPA